MLNKVVQHKVVQSCTTSKLNTSSGLSQLKHKNKPVLFLTALAVSNTLSR